MHDQDETATTDAPAVKARTFGKLICPECGITFTATHQRQSFCVTAHKDAYHNRTKTRGQTIAVLAQAWRAGRDLGRSKTPNADRIADMAARDWAFAELCRIVDEFNAEDNAVGRPSAVRVIRRQQSMNLRQESVATKRAAKRAKGQRAA